MHVARSKTALAAGRKIFRLECLGRYHFQLSLVFGFFSLLLFFLYSAIGMEYVRSPFPTFPAPDCTEMYFFSENCILVGSYDDGDECL